MRKFLLQGCCSAFMVQISERNLKPLWNSWFLAKMQVYSLKCYQKLNFITDLLLRWMLTMVKSIHVLENEEYLSQEKYSPWTKNVLEVLKMLILWYHLLWLKEHYKILNHSVINPFQANIPILYPLKTTENLYFSGIFRGYKMGTLAWNGLI